MVLRGKAVCLSIHLTFTAPVGSRLEQGEYIHTMATLIVALVAGAQEALKTQLTVAEEWQCTRVPYS